ncbi:MAG TPA: HD domain-containing protein [Pirellulales bacterium]|nr:HD domain-containing protein [Pirellulales bacterium]
MNGGRQVAENYRHKVICDPVHGDIGISAVEEQLIDAPSFQRLRKLKQLGLASLVYPNASHSRFAHSLGVFRIMSSVIDFLVNRGKLTDADRRIMRVAALLHDVGHYPYSHLMEYVDRDRHRPTYLAQPKGTRRAIDDPAARYPDHEKIGQLVITQRPDIAQKLSENAFDPEEIASIIRGQHPKAAYNQLIHSSLDMDRMDYMVRDSLGTGVPYGRIDLHYLLNNLDVADDGRLVVSYKAAAAAEHFLVARYFMYKTVYMHKTIFAFEALVRHILWLLRKSGRIYRDGADIEAIVLTDAFLDFHDGYVDRLIDRFASQKKPSKIGDLCLWLKQREPPRLVHEVAVLGQQSASLPADYSLFVKDRAKKIRELAAKYRIDRTRWIWEDPKDIKFESLGPYVALSEMRDVPPDEAAELIHVRERDGSVRPLVEDKNSVIHHLSQLRLRMSRLYVVGPVEDEKFKAIQRDAQAWVRQD